MGTSAHHANAHIMLAGLVLPDTRYSIIMKKRMIWNGNVVANLEESGYLDNDKMLLQCYMRVECTNQVLPAGILSFFFLYSLTSITIRNFPNPGSSGSKSKKKKRGEGS